MTEFFCGWDREIKIVVVFGFATPTDLPYVIVIYLHGGGASCPWGRGGHKVEKENDFVFTLIYNPTNSYTFKQFCQYTKKKKRNKGVVCYVKIS